MVLVAVVRGYGLVSAKSAKGVGGRAIIVLFLNFKGWSTQSPDFLLYCTVQYSTAQYFILFYFIVIFNFFVLRTHKIRGNFHSLFFFPTEKHKNGGFPRLQPPDRHLHIGNAIITRRIRKWEKEEEEEEEEEGGK